MTARELRLFGRSNKVKIAHPVGPIGRPAESSGAVDLPYQMFLMLPFVVTVAAMAAFSRRPRCWFRSAARSARLRGLGRPAPRNSSLSRRTGLTISALDE
jgi:hypothetical protein